MRIVFGFAVLVSLVHANVMAQGSTDSKTSPRSTPPQALVCTPSGTPRINPESIWTCSGKFQGFNIFADPTMTTSGYAVGSYFSHYYGLSAAGVNAEIGPLVIMFRSDSDPDPCSSIPFAIDRHPSLYGVSGPSEPILLRGLTPSVRSGYEHWISLLENLTSGQRQQIKMPESGVTVYPTELADDDLKRARDAVTALRIYVDALEKELASCRVINTRDKAQPSKEQ